MDSITVQKRRTLFWEIFAADVSHVSLHSHYLLHLTRALSSQSLALGRPPSIHLSYVDCEFPTDEEATTSETGESIYGCKYPSPHRSSSYSRVGTLSLAYETHLRKRHILGGAGNHSKRQIPQLQHNPRHRQESPRDGVPCIIQALCSFGRRRGGVLLEFFERSWLLFKSTSNDQ